MGGYYEGMSNSAGCDSHKYPLLHTTHSILFSLSVAILVIFEVELLTLVVVLKFHFFKGLLHVLDLVVVTASLVIELVTHKTDLSMIILFRLWRFVRVGHGLYMVSEDLHEEEIKRVEKCVHELQETLKTNNIEIPKMKETHEEA